MKFLQNLFYLFNLAFGVMLSAKTEPEEMLAAVDPHRQKFGLKPFKELRGEGGEEKETLLVQQKTETVEALSKIAQPCPGIPEVCFIFLL